MLIFSGLGLDSVDLSHVWYILGVVYSQAGAAAT